MTSLISSGASQRPGMSWTPKRIPRMLPVIDRKSRPCGRPSIEPAEIGNRPPSLSILLRLSGPSLLARRAVHGTASELGLRRSAKFGPLGAFDSRSRPNENRPPWGPVFSKPRSGIALQPSASYFGLAGPRLLLSATSCRLVRMHPQRIGCIRTAKAVRFPISAK